MASASPNGAVPGASAAAAATGSVSPRQSVTPKNVAFELLFPEPQYRARLPMRVQIYPHDTTDSIVTTVKNFYGLYSSPTSSKGVSFEDQNGNTLIARYENFYNNMVVYVRVTEEPCATPGPFAHPSYNSAPASTQPYYGPEGYPLQAPPRFSREDSRPTSRSPRRRSPSPNEARGRRSDSAHGSKKGRSRSSKHRDASAHGQADVYSDSVNGYSSGDGASSTASGRMKEQIGNTEISLENIVEGGRRKRAKFESSELPLFAPPQMPAATSNPSVSPARRIEHQRPSLPFSLQGQNPFTNPRPVIQSPQSYNNGYAQNPYYATPAPDHRRARGSISYNGPGVNMGGILPTPDPTVGSCMSEEDKDVAIQLMRLGEMSNISHGRTSASTLDDTFSGRADAASSTGATSDGESESEDELPEARRQKLDAAGTMRKIFHTTESHFLPQGNAEASGDDADYEDGSEENGAKHVTQKAKTSLPSGPKHKAASVSSKSSKASKTQQAPRPAGAPKIKKTPVPLPVVGNRPMSPSSLPPSRKQSEASGSALPPADGDDEQVDLSAKPRCQRCRKSKKGCDRQRPCGRCRDAGLSAEQCISEDEGNGRKGRYGRHMGVSIKKDDVANPAQPALLPAAPISMAAPPIDKNKKRKR